jgi:hypothetical protein
MSWHRSATTGPADAETTQTSFSNLASNDISNISVPTAIDLANSVPSRSSFGAVIDRRSSILEAASLPNGIDIDNII